MGNRVIRNLTVIFFMVYALWWGIKVFTHLPSPPCDFLAVKIDVPLKLMEATTADGGQNPLLTRFFHNKPLFYGINFSRCYFQYFDLPFLLSLLSFPGLIFFLSGIYALLSNWRLIPAKIGVFFLLSLPLLNILDLLPAKNSLSFFAIGLGLGSFLGLWSFLKQG